MPATPDWQLPAAAQPRGEDFNFDLDRALAAVVGLSARIPDDAFTASILGTERAGHGVLISRDGLVLTIGYLITEAETIWLSLADGRTVQGHGLGYDQATGFGLVQALARLDFPELPIGDSAAAKVGERVVVAASGGQSHALAAHIVAKQEFAGYWEYVLDEAIFTAPAHPFWGGAALIGPAGDLIGIGSLQLEQTGGEGKSHHLNMIVPINLLKPILGDLRTLGRVNRPPRPWLGLYATEVGDQVTIAGVTERGPAQRAELKAGDVVLAVAGSEVSDLAGFFRGVWSLGEAGVKVPITLSRDGETTEISITSADRERYLKAPRLH
jgi:S1-C subfamily serine protease